MPNCKMVDARAGNCVGINYYIPNNDFLWYRPSMPASAPVGTYWYDTSTGAQRVFQNIRPEPNGFVSQGWFLVDLDVNSLFDGARERHERIVARTQKRITARRFEAELNAQLEDNAAYEAELARILSNPNYGNF